MTEPILLMEGVQKHYPGVQALRGVSLEIREGEILGLVGENGAGKSTVLNVLCGVAQLDAGEITLRGQPYRPHGYHDAMLHGVARVFQEQALVPNIPVFENMLMSHEARFKQLGVFINKRRMVAQARDELKLLDLDIDPRAETASLDTSTRQAIEIARACSVSSMLGIERPIVLLDEPTAALTSEEITSFFALVRQLRERMSFVFVSHRLTEVLELCDRVYVLKDGQLVAEADPKTTSESRLHALMVGRERDEDYYAERRQRTQYGEVVLEAEGLSHGGFFRDVSLKVRAGEILGIGGVLGSGKNELGRALAGVLSHEKGTVTISGRKPRGKGLAGKMALGLGYVPQERHTEGIMLNLPVDWNMTLASVKDNCESHGRGWLSMKKEKSVVKEYVDKLNVKTPSSKTIAMNLSGGNQQKVVLAKWLMRNPKVLILNNPTFGIDAGAKEEIFRLIRDLTDSDLAVVLISDDLLELIGLSDRILVMKDGVVTSEIDSAASSKPSETEVVAHMV